MSRREPLPIGDIVRAQNLACAGASIAEIALELGRGAHEIAGLIEPEAVLPPRRAVRRGYEAAKRYYG